MASRQHQLELAIVTLLVAEASYDFTYSTLRWELRENDEPLLRQALRSLAEHGLIHLEGESVAASCAAIHLNQLHSV